MWRYTCSQGEEAGTLNHELSHAAKAQQSLKKDLKISLGGTPSAFAISNYMYIVKCCKTPECEVEYGRGSLAGGVLP